MALARIRKADIFLNSKKLGTIQSNSLDVTSGDESMVGADGYLGHSDGAETSSLTCSRISTVDGRDSQLIDAIKKKQYVKIKVALIDGKFADVEMRCVSASWKSESRAGTLIADFTFQGGPVTFTG